MSVMDTMRKREGLLYAAGWAVVFALAAALVVYQHFSLGASGQLASHILRTWRDILPFFLLFVAHDVLATPFLLKDKYLPYALITLVLFGLFAVVLLTLSPRPPFAGGAPPGAPPGGPFGGPGPFEDRGPMDPEVMKLVIGLLVIGVNVGVKAVFNTIRSERKMQELRAQNMGQQLEMLRYQINPHFFMNTLNNIHALVDIDPEKAKESIEEFSKLMRIVLYDGSAPTIPLQRELDYLRHYVSLMRLRYPESVQIDLSFPAEVEGAEVPPLLMASFVENAFKHGISYQAASYVRVSVELRSRQITFCCANSVHGSEDTGPHGIGLENIRKRLDLMYGDAYTLQIEALPDAFKVLLVLPEREAAV